MYIRMINPVLSALLNQYPQGVTILNPHLHVERASSCWTTPRSNWIHGSLTGSVSLVLAHSEAISWQIVTFPFACLFHHLPMVTYGLGGLALLQAL